MGLGKLYFKLIKREYYKDIPIGLLIVNWIFQRIFRINGKVKFSVHYTNMVAGINYINIPNSSKLSFAVSGGCYIAASKKGEINIGEDVVFASKVSIQSRNHDLINRKKYHHKKINIGDNCWIGSSVTILAGVTLGKNVTVGANSVVTKSFPDNVVIGGCPAKIIKSI